MSDGPSHAREEMEQGGWNIAGPERRDGWPAPRGEGRYRVKWSNGEVETVYVKTRGGELFWKAEGSKAAWWYRVGDGHYGRWWPL